VSHRFAGALLVASGLAITFLSVFAAALASVLAAIPAALGVLQVWSGIRIAVGRARPSGVAYVGAAASTLLGVFLLQTNGPPSWPLVAGVFLVGANVVAGWVLMQPTKPAD
jgi:hypothetical protein